MSSAPLYIPQAEELSSISRLLIALSNPSHANHQEAISALTGYAQNKSFVLNLVFVFSYGSQIDPSHGLTVNLRQLAGFVLKNYVFKYLHLLESDIQMSVKQGLLLTSQDSHPTIRKTACILLGRIVEAFPPDFWSSDVLPVLLNRLDSNLVFTTPEVLEGAIFAIKMICEDSSEKLGMDTTHRPLDTLVPRLIGLLSCTEASVRERAIESMNSMLFLVAPAVSSTASNRINDDNQAKQHSRGDGTQAVLLHLQSFLQGISALSADPNPGVRRVVCQSIVLLSSMHLSTLEPIYDSVCSFMIGAVMDNDEGVSCEACEFWYTMSQNVADHLAPPAAVVKHFQSLIPSLINRMILTEEKILQDRQDEEDEASGDKSLNIRPMFGNSGSEDRHESRQRAEEEDELSEQQTIRKQAAVVLDSFGTNFDSNEVLLHAMPVIQSKLSSTNEWERESGLLALGALSNGCLAALSQHIPVVLPFLIQSLQSTTPEIRSIACWVVSRYSDWFFEEAQLDSGLGKEWYVKSFEALLQTLADPKPKVQTAACSALTVLIDQLPSEEYLTPYLPAVFGIINRLFPIYGVKSKVLLLDLISGIASLVGEEGLSGKGFTPLYFPYIMEMLTRYLPLNDMIMYPILECLISVIGSLGFESQPWIIGIYHTCIVLLTNAMAQASSESNSANSPIHLSFNLSPTQSNKQPPPKELAICALDLISSISSAYKSSLSSILSTQQDHLLEILFSCLHDSLQPLRQAAFSVIGELFKHANLIGLIFDASGEGQMPQLNNVFPYLMEVFIINMNNDSPMVFNNSAWAIGELAVRLNKDYGNSAPPSVLGNYLPRICHMISQGMATYPPLDDILLQNLAITWGILCAQVPNFLITVIDDVFQDWCMLFKIIPTSPERDITFQGLITIIHARPALLGLAPQPTSSLPVNIVIQNLSAFLVACASWTELPNNENIVAGIHEILEGCRRVHVGLNQGSGEASPWRVAMQTLSKDEKENLSDTYRLNL